MQGKEGIRVMKVILASGSPRRKELMEKAGLEFEVIPAECEEVIDPALTAEETVMSLASRKASWVAENEKDKRRDKTIVIGADTVVVLDGKILGKPKDKADAFSMLRALSGREHEVYTGVALISPDGKINETFSECTKVKFRSLSDQEIDPAHEQRECGDLTRGTADVVEERLQGNQLVGLQGAQDGHLAQQGGAGEGVHAVDEAGGRRPVGHLLRKRDQQEDTGCDGRIEDVLPDAAEGHLDDADGEEGTDHDDPPGGGDRQVHRQQQAGHERRRAAEQVRVLEKELGDGPLEQHAGGGTDGEDQQGGPAIEKDRHHDRRQQRNDDIPHQGVRRDRRMDMWIG